MRALHLICFVFILSACQPGPSAKKEKGKAVIVPTMDSSQVTGVVTFEEVDDGLKIRGDLHGLPPGKHGFHVHEYGDISDQGKAAGSHFNPNNTKHGLITKDSFTEAHAGDLGNLVADEQGNATVDLHVPKLTLSHGPYPIAGRAMIIHEKEDDFGQPVGNAGARIGGGPILIVEAID